MSQQNVGSGNPFDGIFSNPPPTTVPAPLLITIPSEDTTPLVNHLASLLPLETSHNTAITDSLASLRAMEIEYLQLRATEQARQEAQKISEQILDYFKNNKNYKKAKRIVESISYSSGYTVDLMFDLLNCLTSAHIDIRNNLKQDRHVTPILLIKQILINSLQIGEKLEDIFCSLQSKIEVFKFFLNEKDNVFIQHIFQFFKHPSYQTPSGISLLIKIISHFYNTKGYLIMDDTCVSIPDHVNDVYVIPSLCFGGTKRCHKSEGTFIEAALKFVKGIDSSIDENKNKIALTKTEISQVIYSIFSVFDFLPLPTTVIASTDPEKEKTPNKPLRNRYYGEEIERLYQVAANHLHFTFEAYPALSAFYKLEILNGFLTHLAFGISSEDLCSVLEVDSVFEIQGKVPNMSEASITHNFTNKGKYQGFYRQYCDPKKLTPEEFYKSLLGNTKKILCELSADYFLELDPDLEKSVEKSIRTQSKERRLESLSIKFFTWLINNNLDDFYDLLKGTKTCSIPISITTFANDFLIRIDTVLKEKKDKYPLQLSKVLENTTFKKVMEQLTNGHEDRVISEALKESYRLARKASSTEVTSDTLTSLKTFLLSLEPVKKIDFTDNSPSKDYSDFIAKFHDNTVPAPDEESCDHSFINGSDRSGSFSYSSTETSADNSPIKTKKSTKSSPHSSPISQATRKRTLDSEDLAKRLQIKTKTPKIYRGPLFHDQTENDTNPKPFMSFASCLTDKSEIPVSLTTSKYEAFINSDEYEIPMSLTNSEDRAPISTIPMSLTSSEDGAPIITDGDETPMSLNNSEDGTFTFISSTEKRSPFLPMELG